VQRVASGEPVGGVGAKRGVLGSAVGLGVGLGTLTEGGSGLGAGVGCAPKEARAQHCQPLLTCARPPCTHTLGFPSHIRWPREVAS